MFPELWSAVGISFSFLLYLIMVGLLKPYFYHSKCTSDVRIKYLYWLFVIFCIFPLYAPDTFAYYVYFKQIKSGDTFGIPIEQVYFDLIPYCKNILIFRLAIWGVACLAVWSTLNKLPLKKGYFLLFFIGLFILKYSYGRVYITFALLSLGLAIYYFRNNVKDKLVGIFVVLCAIPFHKSAYFGAVLVIITALLSTPRKMMVKLLLITYPFLIVLFAFAISIFLNNAGDEDLTTYAAKRYLNGSEKESGLGKLIENVLTRAPFYFSCWLFIKTVFSGIYSKFPKIIQKFAIYNFLIIYVATLFAFDLGANTHVYYYRLLHFSVIPASVFLGYLYANKIYIGLLKMTWKIGFVGVIYSFLYTIYNSII